MKGVIIREIELLNYRLFRKAIIIFHASGKQNISVMQGLAGYGKSNLFNAINWCFFNTEPHLKKDSKRLPICNTGILKGMKTGASVETKVSILLETESGEKKIERTIMTHKTAHGENSTTSSTLSVMERIGREWKIAAYPEYTISRIVPEGMRHFFFIDGEMLRQMFENISPDKIKTAIFDLSQVTLLQRAIDHLDSFIGIIRREGGSGGDSNLQQAADALELVEKRIKELQEKINSEEEEIKKARANVKKLDEQIADVDVPALQRFEDQRKSTDAAIVDNENSLQENKQELRDLLFEGAPVVLLEDAITQTLSILNALEKQNKLPPDYQATFIKKLIDHGECICTANLKDPKNKSKLERLKKLLKECDDPGFLGQAADLLYKISPLCRQSEKAMEKIKVLENRVSERDIKLIELKKTLKEIETKIGAIDVKKVKLIQEQREQYRSVIDQCDAKIGSQKAEIDKALFQKNEIEKQYRRLLDKQKRLKVIADKITACKDAQACLKLIMLKLMDEIRLEAEKNTRKYFAHLISGKKFSPPQIDKTYNLIVEKDGYNAVTSLSAAETLCMGYSFMAALRETSGFQAPIVIDTPLAKISKEYRKNVAAWMKEALKEAQIILLVSDVEYTDEFKKAIDPIVADEMMLKCCEKGNYSEVVKYAK